MVLGHDVLTSDRTQDIKISEDVSFDSMLLSPKILKGLKASGFYVPSPIQLHGIPLGKCGFDLLLEAKSGTGKTAVFAIIALEKLNLNKGLQTLMLAPTREIASQICDVIKTIGAYFQGLTVEVVMGGLPFADDVEKLKKTVHIVVGSPGRLYHLISQKHIDVSCVRLMVLDEADKLLEKCFLPDINKIFSLLPSLKQMIMSSATYPENIKTIMKNYVLNAHHICPDSSSVLLGIEQNVTVVSSHINIVKQTKNRYAQLNQILSKKKFKQCLVFCNYQVRVGEVHKMLCRDKWPADQLHGKQQQTDRLEALKVLQEYQCRILVSTDLAARGIDASNVDLVINFEVPYDWQTYLHRIGRAGRFGSYGNAITILSEGDEEQKFKKILTSINIPFRLKYLWSKEPFLLNRSKTVEQSHHNKENESQPKIKESVQKLRTKDEYTDELCKIVSVDSTIPNNEVHDIPTFESLCESFEQANKDSTIDDLESFSDLCSLFQNHEITSIGNYKPVEVNNLMIPCTMFDGNIILKSFQNLKSTTLLTNLTSIDNVDKKDLVECQKSNYYIQSSKPGHDNPNVFDKCRNAENYGTDSDKESSKNQEGELCKSKLIGKLNRSRHQQSETVHNIASLPSTSKSSEYKTNKRSKLNRKVNRNENNAKVFPETKLNGRENFDESVSVAHKSDHNHVRDLTLPDYNDSEKALLAANLPTAFGKSKRNIIQSNTHGDFSTNNLIKINREHQVTPENQTVLTKRNTKQKADSVYGTSDGENEKDSVLLSDELLGGKKHSNGHNLYSSVNKTVITKSNVKQTADSVYESSDDVKTEDDSVSLSDKSHGGKKHSRGHSLHSSKNKTVLTKSSQRTDSVYESSNDEKSEEESDLLSRSIYHKRNAKPQKKTVLTKRNVKHRGNFAYDSSDDEKTENVSGSLPYKSNKDRSSKSRNLRPKITKKRVNNNNEDYRYSVIKERIREFDLWNQELQRNMEILEVFVYLEEMKRLKKLY